MKEEEKKCESRPPPPPQSAAPDVIEVEEEHLVKISRKTTEVECQNCQHIIPIKRAPLPDTIYCPLCTYGIPIRRRRDGHIYVRCKCEWLQVAEPSDFPIQCEHCLQTLQLKPSSRDQQGNLNSYICSYCNQRFETEEDTKFWRCPMCNKKSSLGKNYAMRLAVFFIFIGLLLLCGDAVFIVLTLHKARDHAGMYVGWAGFFIIGLGFLIMGLFYAQIRRSNVYKPLVEY